MRLIQYWTFIIFDKFRHKIKPREKHLLTIPKWLKMLPTKDIYMFIRLLKIYEVDFVMLFKVQYEKAVKWLRLDHLCSLSRV